MPPDVGRAVGMCLQADDKGLLQGDTCLTRTVAKSVAEQFSRWDDARRTRHTMDRVEEVIQLYVKLNFPEVHAEVERRKAMESDDSFTLDNIEADDMDEMMAKIRAAAGML